MPNGLLVNVSDPERDQILRKYLLNEAKSLSSSITDDIKNRMCIQFLVNSYKADIIKKISEFSPKIDDNFTVTESLTDFIQLCEHILENTCSTISNSKRLFNLKSQLKPNVYTLMKSLLKSVNEDENVMSNSRSNGNVTKVNINEKVNKSQTINAEVVKVNNEQKMDADTLNSSISSLKNRNALFNCDKELTVALERLDDSVIMQIINKKSFNNHIDPEKNEIVHPLRVKLLDDLNSDEEPEPNTRKLRSRDIIKIDNEVTFYIYIYYNLMFLK